MVTFSSKQHEPRKVDPAWKLLQLLTRYWISVWREQKSFVLSAFKKKLSVRMSKYESALAASAAGGPESETADVPLERIYTG
jgi:hypothetical protein